MGNSNPTSFTITNGVNPLAGNQVDANEEPGCRAIWDCTAWSACGIDNQQTRTCTKTNACPSEYTNPRPAEVQECSGVEVEQLAEPAIEIEPNQLQSLFSRITGAVTGNSGNNPGFIGLILLLLVLISGYTIVTYNRRKR